jgi:hypothetical protein
MATMTYNLLSGSPANGRGIKVAATSSAGTTIHTAVSGTTDIDIIYLYAVNTDSTDRKLTLEWGGTSAPDDLIEVTIEAESGLKLIAPGIPLQNSLVVKAFAAEANVIIIHGYVHRYDA